MLYVYGILNFHNTKHNNKLLYRLPMALVLFTLCVLIKKLKSKIL